MSEIIRNKVVGCFAISMVLVMCSGGLAMAAPSTPCEGEWVLVDICSSNAWDGIYLSSNSDVSFLYETDWCGAPCNTNCLGNCPTYGTKPPPNLINVCWVESAKVWKCLAKDHDQENAGAPCPPEGNPCSPATGNKYQQETDYASSSLDFKRFYNSKYPVLDTVGKHWQHNYTYKLIQHDTQWVELYRPDGKTIIYKLENSAWKSGPDTNDTLEQTADGWKLTTKEGAEETYSLDGKLLTKTTRDGLVTTFGYSATTGLLERITGPFGHQLTLLYDGQNRLSTLVTPERTEVEYIYDDAHDNLIKVIYPDDTPADTTDNPYKQYHYDNFKYPNHLTGITDENGVEYAHWEYDAEGRAILSERQDGQEKVTLAYSEDGVTTVTDALGKTTTYKFERINGVIKPTGIKIEYNDGVNDQAKEKTYSYDINGNLASEIDWNGVTTNYSYDLARNLETSRTEAVGTPEERTITTEWHPDFRLPTRIVEAVRETLYSYDAQGRLTSKTVQPRQ